MRSLMLLWIWGCAYLNCAGWLLSSAHELNAAGYAAALGLGICLLLVWRQKTGVRFFTKLRWPTLRRRFARPFPLAFGILTVMILGSGIIYAPNNYDGISYRLPRILNWLADNQWHWIHTLYPRVNQRACGVEWISAPIVALTKSDRLLFLINIVSFLLMPGLVYSVFTRLGVSRRAAWHWMWLVPTGYCFLTQAGGIGNDVFGAPFVLAAFDFALRAKNSRTRSDFYSAVLAAALMTSAKTSDLPLLLPWGFLMLPSWRLMFQRPLQLAIVCLIGFAASFLPTAVLNVRFCHDWTGWKAEGTCVKSDPPLRLVDNLALITVQNLAPPIFPMAGAWNRAVVKAIPPALSVRMHETVVEPEAAEFTLDVIQIEEDAGLGFGVSLLFILSVLAAGWRPGWRFRARIGSPERCWLTVAGWLPVVSLIALLTQSEVAPLARILAPYYAVLMPVFLANPKQSIIVGRRWWRVMAGGVFLMAAMVLVISPARPLFPVRTIITFLQGRHVNFPLLERAAAVYTVYAQRNTAFAPAIAQLPAEAKTLGLFTYDDPEASLWQPYGSRRIVHICPGDTASMLRNEGVHYLLIPPEKLQVWFHQTPEEWVRSLNATVIKKIPLNLRASEGFKDWWLVELP